MKAEVQLADQITRMSKLENELSESRQQNRIESELRMKVSLERDLGRQHEESLEQLLNSLRAELEESNIRYEHVFIEVRKHYEVGVFISQITSRRLSARGLTLRMFLVHTSDVSAVIARTI